MKNCAGTLCGCSLFPDPASPMGAARFKLLLTVTLWIMIIPPYMGTAAAASVLPSTTEPLNVTMPGPPGTRSDPRVLLHRPMMHTDPRVLLSGPPGAPRRRSRRAVTQREMNALLDYHNRVRSQVFPPAANMEYMLWDEGLAKSADSWASRCIWDHGPTHTMKYIGQNLSITTGRYQTITDLVRSWYEERHHFSYPNRCTGPVCSHYTQMVWASSNRMGCSVRRCSNMKVFGNKWKETTLLVCNYSIKGNWVGEAPYKSGKPCSVCPNSYGGSCWRNQCAPKHKHIRLTR